MITGPGEGPHHGHPPQRFSESAVGQSAGFTFSFFETIRPWKIAITST
ncbi:MAG: hypothetical protein ABF545_02725 [Bifidobacterium psychraerophilum]